MLELSDEGTEAIIDGRFEEAAAKFREAYQAFPDPVLLKNEMIAWYRAGYCIKAIPAAAGYLQSGEVTDSDRRDVNKVQVVCNIQLAEEALADNNLEAAESLIQETQKLEMTDEQHAQLVALQDHLEEQRPKPELEPVPAPPSPGVSKQMIGWGLTGSGAVMLTGAIVYHIVALDRQSELYALRDSRAPGAEQAFKLRQAELTDPQRRARWMVPTLYTLGAALTAGGVYFLLIESGEDQPAIQARLFPAVSGSSAGARLHISF
ncbi:MAG: hypothetical protein H0U74_01180 [Bradymonadaceae bacterium]|nr:hypothetical protein [Lujinxingiaceae bacterium]